MPDTLKRTTRLRQLLQVPGIVMAPGAFNALSALLVEQAGFPAIYVTGAGLASNFIGVPDIGLVSMSEVLENARHIVQATSVPVICEADTGIGNAINVIRTLREFEAAGLAAIQLEDQVMLSYTQARYVQKNYLRVILRKESEIVEHFEKIIAELGWA